MESYAGKGGSETSEAGQSSKKKFYRRTKLQGPGLT